MSETIAKEQETKKLSATQEQLDILDQLLKPEVQESLNALVEQLPKLTEIVNLMTKSYDYAQLVATDEILKNDTVGAIKEVAGPVVGSVKSLAQTAIEAKDRADQSKDVVGLFGLLKMLKDPQAQKLFRFANAFLEVNAQRNQK
ncbi:DUF1641 domain-containing protein [Peribacillus loiseleuriae]|uniref:DUF1641 domain-containing protein n=1 Tax=Peribacillus loiseleuriae TaxID=1679170 RepID=UPI0037FE0D85